MDKKAKRTVEKVTPKERDSLLVGFLPFLAKGKFVNVATCSNERMPNVAPKLIAKTEKNIIYLIDYVIGKTYSNLKENPRASLSFINDRTLTGYQMNGSVDVLESGEEFEKFIEEFQKIKTDFTVERILLNVRIGEKATPLDLSMPDQFAILKVKVIEIVEIGSSGSLRSKLAF
ncbi:MAG: pyridoxamine 5'-phosphate oxidase family protein [Candidatus Omnitrophota bacterium]